MCLCPVENWIAFIGYSLYIFLVPIVATVDFDAGDQYLVEEGARVPFATHLSSLPSALLPPPRFFLCPHVGTSPAHQKFLEEGNADASHWLLENTVYVRLEAGLRKSIVNSIQN